MTARPFTTRVPAGRARIAKRPPAITPRSRQKRRATWARYRAEEREAVRVLCQQGIVPLAIGPTLSMPDSTVTRYLRELEQAGSIEPVPAFLERAVVERS
jgi:hypothetical protein